MVTEDMVKWVRSQKYCRSFSRQQDIYIRLQQLALHMTWRSAARYTIQGAKRGRISHCQDVLAAPPQVVAFVPTTAPFDRHAKARSR
jgi:hypothetical protein